MRRRPEQQEQQEQQEGVMFSGSLVALITPFRGGEVDEAALERLIAYQLEHGTHGLVPCGTTGESPTLTPAEHEAVVALTVRAARDYAARTGRPRVPVIAGAGSNSTHEAIHYSRTAERDGADGLLHVTPYYNKPTQEGLYRHFAAIAAATDLPIILYNVPGRTGVNLLPETVARLAALPIMAVGGSGVISVVANVAPAQVAGLVDAWRAGRRDEAQRRHDELFELARTMFLETNPGPVKAAAELLGLCSGELRLPLAPVGAATLARIEAALDEAGLRAGAVAV